MEYQNNIRIDQSFATILFSLVFVFLLPSLSFGDHRGAALPDWMTPIVIIARETGLRLSNIAELQWSQVNLFNKSITIETTKNGDPLGLPITDNVLKELNKVRRLDSDYNLATV